MEVFIKTSQFLLSISILVLLHEMGHFFFAKLFKTRVEKFYLFFNPWFSLFKFKKGETEYGLGWLPLGGYVKISGMIDESMDKEQMKQPPQPHEFRSKKSWQRLLIMLGGVLVNFVLAMFIYILILFTWGEKYLPVENAKYGIMCDSIAQTIGLQNGDKILAVDGNKIENFNKIVHDIIVNNSKSIVVERNSEIVNISIPSEFISQIIKNPLFISPRMPFIIEDMADNSPAALAGFRKNDKVIAFDSLTVEFYDEVREMLKLFKGKEVLISVIRDGFVVDIPFNVPETAQFGVYVVTNPEHFFELKSVEYSFLQSIPAGISKGFATLSSYMKQLKLLFTPETKAYESLGGFISIGKIFPGEWDWQSFWSLTAFLSIILAIMNVLPIPALDGGHVLFLLYEMITGRKPSDKFLEYAQMVGMGLLLALLLYANLNDIIKLF
jgi:regulator of sigma E protease